jgi:hypothetical protein
MKTVEPFCGLNKRGLQAVSVYSTTREFTLDLKWSYASYNAVYSWCNLNITMFEWDLKGIDEPDKDSSEAGRQPTIQDIIINCNLGLRLRPWREVLDMLTSLSQIIDARLFLADSME